jgi:molybdopterin molybdotransferase
MINPHDALELVLNSIKPKNIEEVGLFEAAGRVLAGKSVSKRNIPIADSSAMDGYAMKAEDIAQVPVTLKVKGIIAAGDDVSAMSISAGECYRLMTGSNVPAGADTVVQHEHTDNGKVTVTINKSAKKGANVRYAAEDTAVGQEFDFGGRLLNPYLASRLASMGELFVNVHIKPRVAVVSTGSEISGFQDYGNPNKMLDANAPALMGLIREAGGEAVYKGVIPDEEEALRSTLLSLADFDMIVVSGGISVGDFDCMAKISENIGIKWAFHHVNQKPGKPIAFGKLKETPIFAMPGNPVSCMFCAYFYLVPAVRKLSGMKNCKQRHVKAVIAEPFSKKKDRIQFDRAIVENKDGVLYATLYRSQNSNLISSMSFCQGFVELADELEGNIPSGTEVKLYIFDGDNIG